MDPKSNVSLACITECSICYENVNLETQLITDCNHIFHRECILRWTLRNNTCPLCRRPIYPPILSPELLPFPNLPLPIQPNQPNEPNERNQLIPYERNEGHNRGLELDPNINQDANPLNANIYVPLNFWFSGDMGLALPYVALPVQRYVHINLPPYEDLV